MDIEEAVSSRLDRERVSGPGLGSGGGSGMPSDDEVIARIRSHHRGRRLPPPASEAAVACAEALVGHAMPALLKRIYLEVSDGLFDDRACALPLLDAAVRSPGAVNRRHVLDAVPEVCFRGPFGVVPLRCRDGAVWTHVDWRTPEGRLWSEEGGRVFPEECTLAERLVLWTKGREALSTERTRSQ